MNWYFVAMLCLISGGVGCYIGHGIGYRDCEQEFFPK